VLAKRHRSCQWRFQTNTAEELWHLRVVHAFCVIFTHGENHRGLFQACPRWSWGLIPSDRNMNRRRAFFIVGLLALVAVAVLLLRLHEPSPPSFRLKIVRQTVENGKPVVVFRVEGGEGRRIMLGNIERLFDDRIDRALKPSDFWAQSQQSPIWDPEQARKEFGVPPPKDHQGWKLRVTVCMAQHRTLRWLTTLPTRWREIRKLGVPPLNAIRSAWSWTPYANYQTIESDVVTNSVAEPPNLAK